MDVTGSVRLFGDGRTIADTIRQRMKNELGKSMEEVFVKITAEHDMNGTVRPLEMTWGDGRRFSIDRILDIRQAASLKGGGLGCGIFAGYAINKYK